MKTIPRHRFPSMDGVEKPEPVKVRTPNSGPEIHVQVVGVAKNRDEACNNKSTKSKRSQWFLCWSKKLSDSTESSQRKVGLDFVTCTC